MQFITNPTGQAAVPDGRGGIKFVPSASLPPGQPWGHYRYQDAQGVPQVARGPRPAVGGYDWRADATASLPASPATIPARSSKGPPIVYGDRVQVVRSVPAVPPQQGQQCPSNPASQHAAVDASWEASIQRVTGGKPAACTQPRTSAPAFTPPTSADGAWDESIRRTLGKDRSR